MKIKASSFYINLLLTVLFTLAAKKAQAQYSEEVLTKYFDQRLGCENLEINNGTVHVNEFRVSNNKHRYYPNDIFEKGNITYNSQQYFDIAIKYDIYNDILVYKPQNSNIISINLIKEKATSFTINNKKFVYIDHLLYPLSPIKTGYYEECVSGKSFIFYIRHHRNRREIIKGSSIYNEFDDNYEYYIKSESTFNRINSKKDILKIFPELKQKINDLYSAYDKLKKTNETAFYEKLMTYLNNTIENNTK